MLLVVPQTNVITSSYPCSLKVVCINLMLINNTWSLMHPMDCTITRSLWVNLQGDPKVMRVF